MSKFDHRDTSEYNNYNYDGLDRLADVTYYNDDTEAFTMDTLGNRTNVNDRNDDDIPYVVDTDTNRYEKVDNLPPSSGEIGYDFAGNMTEDKDGIYYFYDYENRLVKIEDSGNAEMATFDGACPERSRRDALGRRIRKIDKTESPDVTTLYYYNPEWQVLIEFDESDWLRYYVYGNYIDEPLVMRQESDSEDYYYAQNHLYSVVALTDDTGTVVERYEYDAYGKCAGLGTGADGLWFTGDDITYSYSDTDIGNPYTFTGRRLDAFDTANLLSMHYRHRTYDTYTGRFLQEDPIGRDFALSLAVDGMNLYEAMGSNSIMNYDALGLTHDSHVKPEWGPGWRTAKSCIGALLARNGCFLHSYSRLRIIEHTGTYVGATGWDGNSGLLKKVILAILEGLAGGSGGSAATNDSGVWPTIITVTTTVHMYFHHEIESGELNIYRGIAYEEESLEAESVGDVIAAPDGQMSSSALKEFRRVIDNTKPRGLDYDYWGGDGVWYGGKFGWVEVKYPNGVVGTEYCIIKNFRD